MNLEKSHEPSVAIIVVNWNSYETTRDLFNSLQHLTYENFKVFLIDNDSKDDSFAKLMADYQAGEFIFKIEFVKADENLGFAGGNNLAIKRAIDQNYDYFWMLNNDTVVKNDTLKPLVDQMEADSETGMVGSKIYFFDSDLIWFAGGEVNQLSGETRHIGNMERESGQYNVTKEVDYITGCSLMFRKEVIDTVGYMNDDYFLYYEETEWCIRCHQAGWKIVYVPDSELYHKVSSSSGGEDNKAPYVDYYFTRNSFVMIRRTRHPLISVVSYVMILWRSLKQCVKITIGQQDQKFKRILYILTALLHGLTLRMGKHPVL